MAKHTKSLEKLRALPPSSSIKWDELTSVLKHLGFKPVKPGKSGGSRRKFYHKEKDVLIACHEPHPSPNVDKGCIADIVDILKTHRFI